MTKDKLVIIVIDEDDLEHLRYHLDMIESAEIQAIKDVVSEVKE